MSLSHISPGKSRLRTGEHPSQEPSLISWMERPRETLCLEPLWPQLSPFARVYSLHPRAHPILQNKQALGVLKEGLLEPER